MDDFSRLKQKLVKLRQRDRAPGEKRILRGNGEELLSAIVTEFDETILPRRLTFAADNGSRIEVAVANRRLQALMNLEPGGGLDPAQLGVELKNPDDPVLELVRAALLVALKDAKTVDVSATKQAGSTFASDVGISTEQLQKVWSLNLDADGNTKSGSLKEFVEELGKKSSGWLRIEGEDVAAQGGDAEIVSELGNQAAIFLDGFLAQKEVVTQGEIGPSGCIMLGKTSDALVFLDGGDSMAFLRAKPEIALEIANSWQSVFAQ